MNSSFVEPAVVGGTASALAMFLSNGSDIVNTPLGAVPGWVPVGVSVGVASYVADMVKDKVIPKDNANQVVATLAKPAITGAAGVAALYATTAGNMDSDSVQGAFILGAASELLGSYIFDKAVSKYY